MKKRDGTFPELEQEPVPFFVLSLASTELEPRVTTMQPPVSNPRLLIETWHCQLMEDVARKDADAIRALHCPDYIEIQTTGEQLGAHEVWAEWRECFDEAVNPRLRIEIDSVDLDVNAAIARVRFILSYVSSPFPSLIYDTRIETSRREYWEGSDGEWRLRKAEGTRVRSWINGNLISDRRPEPPLSAAQLSTLVDDLNAYAEPLKTVLAGNGFEDLACLDSIVGDARIVALGEASHGTAEFFRMKHRLLEYLVEKKGFTVFAIEGNWPDAEIADRFIKTGEGDPVSALAAMRFWTWRTEEVRDMLIWMRSTNAKRSPPLLSFAGFDMQFVATAIESVAGLFERVGGEDYDTVRKLYDGMSQLDTNPQAVSVAEKWRLNDNAAAVLELIYDRRDRLNRAVTPKTYRDMRQAARVIWQATRMHSGVSWAVRDRAMAENVRWLLEERFPGEKIVLWAHNGHIATRPAGGEPSLGMHLRARYSSEMFVLGFASYEGEVRAKRVAHGKFLPGPPTALPLAPAKKGSIEAVFREADPAVFLLDLRTLPENAALGQWLSKPRLHRSIGSGYDPDRPSDNYLNVYLPGTYDSIVFVRDSTAAKPLPSPPVGS